MNIIESNTSFDLLPEGRRQVEANPRKVGSKIASAIASENNTLRKLTTKFYGGTLAPRSEEYRRSQRDCENYIKNYLSWMIDQKWISKC